MARIEGCENMDGVVTGVESSRLPEEEKEAGMMAFPSDPWCGHSVML